MKSLTRVDNQPIDSRYGDSVWLTSFITPKNPTVQLRFQELTKGLEMTNDRIVSLWSYVANQKYNETIASTLHVGGKSFRQSDTWFHPAEATLLPISNCANRSFLLASLLKNELSFVNDVFCALGYINLDGIGAHAWVEAKINGEYHIVETTQPNLPTALIPANRASHYEPVIYFDENSVFTVDKNIDVKAVLNARYGLCAIKLLENYLCEECLGLEG